MSASPARVRDPFGPAASVTAYVPYAACERALGAMERSLEKGGRVVALLGPAGLGKTLLLHCLAMRASEHVRPAYLPFCSLSLAELCAFALDRLEIEAGNDPVASLTAYARELAAEGAGLLLLIDDVGALPDETARELAALVAQLGGAVSVAMAALDGPEAERVCNAFGDAPDVVELSEGMSERESRRYVQTRLALADAPSPVRAVFDDPAIEALHRESGGVPRRLNLAAQARMRDVLEEESLPRIGAARRPAAEVTEQAPGPADEGGLPGDEAVLQSLTRPEPPAAPLTPEAEAREDRDRVAVNRDAHMQLGAYRYAKGRQVGGVTRPEEGASRRADGVIRPSDAGSRPAADSPPAVEAPPAASETQRDEQVDRTLALFVEGGQVPPSLAAREGTLRGVVQRIRLGAGQRRRWTGITGAFATSAVAFAAGVCFTAGGSKDTALSERSRDVIPMTEIIRALESAGESGLRPRSERIPFGSGVLDPRAEPEPLPAPPSSAGATELSTFLQEFLGKPQPQPQPPRPVPERSAPRPESTLPVLPAGSPRVTIAVPDPDSARPPVIVVWPVPEPAAVAASEPAAPKVAPSAPPSKVAASGPAPTHSVAINATPWASIEVDGRALGETPIAGIELEEGRHRFRARMPDGSVREQLLQIDADHRYVVFE